MTDRPSDDSPSESGETPTPAPWRVTTDAEEVLTHTDPESAVSALDTLSTPETSSPPDSSPSPSISDPRPRDVRDFLHRVPHLLAWAEEHGREFPWRPTDDPWRVYGIEILLQRTRAEAVAGVYNEFFERFPTPAAIVEADPDEITDVVAPLGFGKRRARILRAAATAVETDHGGKVPVDDDDLRRPSGIGPYTARATAVFAHGTLHGLIDTNTARIFGRVFGLSIPSKADEGDASHLLVDSLTPSVPQVARAFNLSLLDLGAMVCTPTDPDCSSCPLQSACAHGRSRGHSANDGPAPGTDTDAEENGTPDISEGSEP